jgi:hypothetical protein
MNSKLPRDQQRAREQSEQEPERPAAIKRKLKQIEKAAMRSPSNQTLSQLTGEPCSLGTTRRRETVGSRQS